MKKVLMGCYTQIENDGRILRSIDGLKALHCSIDLVSFDRAVTNDGIKNHHAWNVKRNRNINLWAFSIFFLQKVRQTSPNIVYLHDYYMCLAGLLVKLIRPQTKVIYDAHELLISGEQEASQSKRLRFFSFIEKLAVKKFNVIITANAERAKIMVDSYRLQTRPIAIKNIPNVPSLCDEAVESFDLDDFIKRKRLEGVKVLVYQGVMSKGRKLDKYIDVISMIKTKLCLVFIGDGPFLAEMKRTVHEKCLGSNILFIDKMKVNFLYGVLRRCDFGLISYSNVNLNNRYCAPNKLYEYASLNLPFITTNQQTIVQEVEGFSFAHTFDIEDDVSNIANSISQYVDSYVLDISEFDKFNTINRWDIEREKFKGVIEKCLQ